MKRKNYGFLLHTQLVAEIVHDRLIDGVEILFTRAAAAHRADAEHMSARLPRAVEVAVIRLRLHVDRGLHDVDLERAEMRHGAAHIFLERFFKRANFLIDKLFLKRKKLIPRKKREMSLLSPLFIFF